MNWLKQNWRHLTFLKKTITILLLMIPIMILVSSFSLLEETGIKSLVWSILAAFSIGVIVVFVMLSEAKANDGMAKKNIFTRRFYIPMWIKIILLVAFLIAATLPLLSTLLHSFNNETTNAPEAIQESDVSDFSCPVSSEEISATIDFMRQLTNSEIMGILGFLSDRECYEALVQIQNKITEEIETNNIND